MTKKLRPLHGGRKEEDIYDRCEKVGYVDIKGEWHADGQQIGFFPFYHYGPDPQPQRGGGIIDEHNVTAKEVFSEITTDRIERSIAEFTFDYGFSEIEVAEIILGKWKLKSVKDSRGRVKRFLRKMEASRKNE